MKISLVELLGLVKYVTKMVTRCLRIYYLVTKFAGLLWGVCCVRRRSRATQLVYYKTNFKINVRCYCEFDFDLIFGVVFSRFREHMVSLKKRHFYAI